MIKIYIASPLRFTEYNETIRSRLERIPGTYIFLPISLHEVHGDRLEDTFIAQRCYDEIDSSDLIVLVKPFGLSVAAEIGYIISQKRSGSKKSIVAIQSSLGNIKSEAMISPYIDREFYSIEALEGYVTKMAHHPHLF